MSSNFVEMSLRKEVTPTFLKEMIANIQGGKLPHPATVSKLLALAGEMLSFLPPVVCVESGRGSAHPFCEMAYNPYVQPKGRVLRKRTLEPPQRKNSPSPTSPRRRHFSGMSHVKAHTSTLVRHVLPANKSDTCEVIVVGDLHGSLRDLISILAYIGQEPSASKQLIFNGDFVDRGCFGTEIMLILISLKLCYPEYVHLVRGNHESGDMIKSHGFAAEFKEKFSQSLLNVLVQDVFFNLPIGIVLNKKIFVCHGGIPENPSRPGTVLSIAEICDLLVDRGEVKPRGVLTDCLWSDPHPRAVRESLGEVDDDDEISVYEVPLWSTGDPEPGTAIDTLGTENNFVELQTGSSSTTPPLANSIPSRESATSVAFDTANAAAAVLANSEDNSASQDMDTSSADPGVVDGASSLKANTDVVDAVDTIDDQNQQIDPALGQDTVMGNTDNIAPELAASDGIELTITDTPDKNETASTDTQNQCTNTDDKNPAVILTFVGDSNSKTPTSEKSSPTESPKENPFVGVCADGFVSNHLRGAGHFFGIKALNTFLQREGFTMLVRSHQGPDSRHDINKGYAVDMGGKCVTVFSSSCYRSQYQNRGAVVVFKGQNLDMTPTNYPLMSHFARTPKTVWWLR